jgi:hypothetical protein
MMAARVTEAAAAAAVMIMMVLLLLTKMAIESRIKTRAARRPGPGVTDTSGYRTVVVGGGGGGLDEDVPETSVARWW